MMDLWVSIQRLGVSRRAPSARGNDSSVAINILRGNDARETARHVCLRACRRKRPVHRTHMRTIEEEARKCVVTEVALRGGRERLRRALGSRCRQRAGRSLAREEDFGMEIGQGIFGRDVRRTFYGERLVE